MREMYLRSRWLENMEGSDLDRGIAITHFPALVGRSSECDYQIHQPLISRRHCSFYLKDGQIWVLDLGSLNGTYLNGQRDKSFRTKIELGERVEQLKRERELSVC